MCFCTRSVEEYQEFLDFQFGTPDASGGTLREDCVPDNCKILIVDDNKVALRAAGSALEAAGYDVVTRSEPIGTTATIIRERPSVVLLDVNMPALEGDDIVRAIRRCPSVRDTVVLLYSSEPADRLERLVDECKADGYICKSSETSELCGFVARWVRPPAFEPVPLTDNVIAGSEP